MQCFLSLEMIVRLYCNEKLKEIGQTVCLNDKQIHYLGNVLRMKIGDVFYLFDGENGEFEAQISDMSKEVIASRAASRNDLLSKHILHFGEQGLADEPCTDPCQFLRRFVKAGVVPGQDHG